MEGRERKGGRGTHFQEYHFAMTLRTLKSRGTAVEGGSPNPSSVSNLSVEEVESGGSLSASLAELVSPSPVRDHVSAKTTWRGLLKNAGTQG